jgi:hypothetical protein
VGSITVRWAVSVVSSSIVTSGFIFRVFKRELLGGQPARKSSVYTVKQAPEFAAFHDE